MSTTRRRKFVDARDSLGLESDNPEERAPTPYPSYPPDDSPLRETKRNDEDEDEDDDAPDGYEAIGGYPIYPAVVEPGPQDRVVETSGPLDWLRRPSTLVWFLPLLTFLLGWVAKDVFTTVSLSRNPVQRESDTAYQRLQEALQAERNQSAVDRKKWEDTNAAKGLVEFQLKLERQRTEQERERRQQEQERCQKEQERCQKKEERCQKEEERRQKEEERRQKEEERRQREEERRQKEEERRQKARMRWAKPQPDPQCLRHGARVWTAKLENIPANYNPSTACYETEALIHGHRLRPDFCETDMKAGTFGIWHITFNEAACRPRWSPVTDKGCTSEGSGKRKFEAQLEGLHSGDNWQAMCSSTPAEFNGWRFDGPHSCDQGIWGYRGFWFVEDNICA